MHGRFRRSLLAAILLTSSHSLIWAQPQDATVVSGQAALSQIDPHIMHIQASDKTIINWKEFSIAQKEVTRFLLPDKHSAILNRVTGKDLSLIDGKLLANGKVFLINRNGVIIGPNGRVDAGGFIASSLDLLDGDFLSGGDLLFSGDSLAKVQNLGHVQVADGGVVFIGYFVENKGDINASGSDACLAAGAEVLLKLEGDENIAIHPKRAAAAREGTGIENSGSIEAIRAELKADGNLYAMAINHTGSVQALDVVEKQGRVLLVAEGGETHSSGSIAAKSGEVHLLGSRVSLTEEARIDVSGQSGGTVLIGGDYQGRNPSLFNAESTFVGKDVRVEASTLESGNGGRVIVWAEGETHFHGAIEAKGGMSGGDGGFVEVSGKKHLDYKGQVNLTAPQGNPGTLLLDPTDLVISAVTATSDVSYPAVYMVGSDTIIEPNMQVPISYLLFSDLQTQLGLSNVIVQTLPDTVTPASSAGDITWEAGANVTNVANTNLTINAYRDFNTAAFYDAMGTGFFTANAGRDINMLDLGMGSSPKVITAGGDATFNAGRNITLNSTNSSAISGGNTTLQAGGLIDIVGGANVQATNTLNVLAVSDITCQGTALASSTVQLSGRSVNIISNQGDIALLAGTGGISVSGAQILSQDLNLQAQTGNLILTGSSDSVSILSRHNMNISVAQDFIMTGGDGLGTSAVIQMFGINATVPNIKVGGNCILQGGPTMASLALPNGAIIQGTIGVNLEVGKDLQILGGAGEGAVASVTTFTGPINISVGKDIILTAGQAQDAFAQIGGSYLGTGLIDININSFGGDLRLTGSSSSVSGAYALIGNGGQNPTAPQPSSGNILISGSTGSNVVLTGGSGSACFAQIGHPNYGPDMISGDIRIANIGNNVELTASPFYAMIGHGTDMFSATSISGNITLDAIGGDVVLSNHGQFVQIGHINCSGLTQGDVTVNTPTGAVSLSSPTMGAGSTTIGHGNTLTTMGAPQFQGQISVNADSVNIASGSSSNSDATIGFSVSPSFNGSLTIQPTSNVSVTAEKNILIQGTSSMMGSGANGIIGFLSSSTPSTASVIMTDVQVASTTGDITLIGNLGTAFIGTRLTSGSFNPNYTTQSNIAISAPQGTLRLTPSVANGLSGTGHAIIANSNAFAFFNSIPPVNNVGIDVGRLEMTGSPAGSGVSGTAEIFSAHNVDVKTAGDLTMIVPVPTMGGAVQGTCNISSGDSTMIFDIGENLEMIAGSAAGSFVQIGTSVVIAGQRDILFKNIGGNASLIAGNQNTGCYAQIGNTAFNPGVSVIGQINIDHIGGNLTLTGGSTTNSSSIQGCFAQIGHNPPSFGGSSISLNGDVFINQVDGLIHLTAGTDNLTYALIGHSLAQTSSSSSTGQIFVQGTSIALAGTTTINNNGFIPDNATIGFELGSASSPTVTSAQIHASASDRLTLSGEYAGTNFMKNGGEATIGVHAYFDDSSATITIEKLNVFSSSGDIILNTGVGLAMGNTASNAVIGYYHPSTLTAETVVFQNIQVRSELGNINLNGGSQFPTLGTSFIGTLTNSTPSNTLAASNIAVQAPLGTIALYGIPNGSTFGTGHATISNVTNTTSAAANYDVSIDVNTLSLNGSPAGMSPIFGRASIFSNRNLDINTQSDLLLLAGNGAATINANGIMTFDIGGNVELFGGSNSMGGQLSIAQIGNPTVVAMATTLITGDIHFKNIGGICTLNGGSVANAFARIGHGNPTSNENISGQILIDQIGGDLTLNGGSDSSGSGYAQIGHYGADQIGMSSPSTIGDIVINNTDGMIQLTSGIIGHAGGTSLETFTGQILVHGNSINMLGNGTTPGGVSTVGNSTIGFDLLSNANPVVNSTQIQVSAENAITLTGGDAGMTPSSSSVQGEATIGIRNVNAFRATIDKLSVSSSNGDIILTAGSPTTTMHNGGNAIIGYYNVETNFANVTINDLSVSANAGNVVLVGGANDPTNLNTGTSIIGTVTNNSNMFVSGQSQITVNAPLGNLSLSSLPNTSNLTSNVTNGNALIANNNFQGPLAPYDVTLNVGSLTMVGLPSGVTNAGGKAAIYSSRNITLQTAGDLQMNPGGDSMNNGAPTTISNGSGVMTFDIGGNVIMNADFSVAQIGNALVNGPSDILFKNIGGNLFLTGGSANTPGSSYAQIGHGLLTSTGMQAQDVQGQILIDYVGGDVTLTGGSFVNSYAQIGHADPGVGTASSTLTGDVIISNVQGGVNLLAGSGGGLAAIIGHSGSATSSMIDTYSGKILVSGNTVKLDANNNSLISANVTIGFDASNVNASIISDQIQVSALNSITINGGNALGGGMSNADATIGVHKGMLATVTKLGVSSTNGDITLSSGVPTNTGNQGGNAVIGYYNYTNVILAPVNVVIQNIQVDTASGNIVLTGGNGTQTPPISTGTAFIGTSTTNTSGTLAVSNIAIQAPLGTLALSGEPFQNSTANFGMAFISNVTNNTNTTPSNFDISIDVDRLVLTGTFQGMTTTQYGQAIILSARNLDIQTQGDMLLVSGSGLANIFNGNGIMNFDVGANVELLGGTNTSGGAVNPSAQIGSQIGTFGPVRSDMVFKNIGGNVLLSSGTGNGYARIGHGGLAAASNTGQIVIDSIGGNLTLNSTSNIAQVGHFGTGITSGDIVINNVAGLTQINGGVIGQAGSMGSFSGQVLIQGNGFNLQNGNSTIGFDVGGTVTSNQITVSALNDITLTGGTGTDATIGVHNFNLGSSSGTVGKLGVFSTNGDIILTGGSSMGGGGNAAIGYFNIAGATSVVINDLSVNSTMGDITLLGGAGGGSAFIGTQSASAGTQSQILIEAPLGILSLTGSSPLGAFIANSIQGSAAPVDIAINVNRALLTTSNIFSSRNFDFISRGDLILNAGTGSTNIQNSVGIMTFDIGGNLELFGGTSFAQIGIPTAGTTQSNMIFKEIKGNLAISGGAGANAYARIGHGSQVGMQAITGQIIIDSIGGSLTLNNLSSIAQVGHFGTMTTTGDIIINNVAALTQINGGVIGHAGSSGTFSGQILVQGNGFNLQGGNSTIGFDVGGIVTPTQITVSALNDITLSGGAGTDATIGIHALNAGSPTAPLAKLGVFSINGDIILTGGTLAGSSGNAVIGYYNTVGGNAVSIGDLSVNTAMGDITLNAPSTGTAFIGTQSTSLGTQSQILIEAPLGILSLTGTSPLGAFIANSTQGSGAQVDIAINVNRALLTRANIFSSRNFDFISRGDLILTAGTGSTNIQNSIGIMTFDIGGNLQLTGGTSFAQIGIPTAGTTQSNMVFKEIKGNLAISGGIGANAYARIGHGSPGAAQAIAGQIVIDQVGGNLTLTGGSGGGGSFGQIGHYGSDSAPVATNGDVVVNNVDGYIQLTPGSNTQSSSVIGHSGGFGGGGTFSGQVIVQGTSVNLFGNTGAAAANSTIGYSLNTAAASTVTSSQIQVITTEGITLSVDVFNANGGDATIGLKNVLTGTVGKLNVSTTNGDIALNAGITGIGGNAVIGYFNTTTPATITINDLNVNSSDGNIFLVGGNTGSAFIGTSSTTAAAQSQIMINAPNGTLNLYGLPIGSTIVAGGKALIGNALLGSSVPFDVSINVNKALIVGSPTGTAQAGTAQIYSGRNLNFTSAGDLLLTPNTGASSIGNSNGKMTFDVGANVQLLGGSGATSIAQIGNRNPSAGINSTILFNNIGGSVQLQGGSSAGSYALIGHFENNGTALNGDVLINAVEGDLNVTAGAGSFAQIGHFGQMAAVITGDVSVNNVQGSINLSGGNAVQTSAVIGHGGSGNNYSGQVLVQGNKVILQGGAAVLGPATIGFEDSTSGFTVNSTQVQVSAPTAITLNAGTAGNAVIGCYSNTQTGNVVINNVNVLSNNGDVTLNASGASAVIGTRLNAGTSRSNVKITTTGNILLQSASTGSALIVNNRAGASGSTNISLDPNNIILLSGPGGGTAQIYSGNNLDVNFVNRLDLNFDANNPGAILTGVAQILASGDININTDQTSRGNITLQGTSSGQVTEINSIVGNISIGTTEAAGAQNLIIGTGAGVISGVARILAQAGDIFVNALKNVTLTGTGVAPAEIIAGGEIIINNGRDLTLSSNSLIQNTNSYPLTINAGNDVTLSTPTISASILSPGIISVNAGRDLNMALNALIQSSGTYPLTATAGNNVNISSNANLSQTGGGELTAVANRNMTISGTAVVSTVNTNLTLVVDNSWPDSAKFGTGFFTVSSPNVTALPNGRVRIFTSTQALHSITASINGAAYSMGPIYVNTNEEQWQTYWDSAFVSLVGQAPYPFTIFYKDTIPVAGPVDCVNICNFPACFDLCNPPPAPTPCPCPSPSPAPSPSPSPTPSPSPSPCPPLCPPRHPHPHHHHHHAKNRKLTNKLILETFDTAYFEAFQDWRTYDYFFFTPVPIEVCYDCCDYMQQLYPDNKGKYANIMTTVNAYGPTHSCQMASYENYGVLRPEHWNYHNSRRSFF